ncbi:hypothetical protein JCM10908_000862 [Rhodotorula pacifica]|uniref:uncharacterized protein n=1 Tax=Rhodotorula pacifica TaxID=1495444 RepID=UPI00317612FC
MQLIGVPAPLPSQPTSSAAPPPLAVVRTFRAYYSPLELHNLVHLQAQHHGHGQPNKLLSDHRIELYRQLAAGFIERVANRLGFPRRTIATAQKLYHRFHLHFPLVDFPYHDVSLAALLVASKLEDTLKKLRDIQIAAWQVGNLLEGGNGIGEGDPAAQESHRPHLIGIERLILQTICFNLNLHRPLGPAPSPLPSSSSAHTADSNNDDLLALATTTVEAGSLTTGDGFKTLFRLAASIPSLPLPLRTPLSTSTSISTSTGDEPPLKSLTRLAFLLLTDLHRTIAPLSFPPHTCAAACIYLAGFLMCAAANGARDGGAGAIAGEEGGVEGEEGEEVWDGEMALDWAEMCESDAEDISDISQTLLDLLISLCPPPPLNAPPPNSNNGTTPSTTSPHLLISPHSSLASPSESASSLTGGGNGKSSAATSSEREKHLLAAGCPNAFTHPALRGGGGAGGGRVGTDELMRLKIRVRRATARRRKRPAAAEEEDAADDADESERLLKRGRRWQALEEGLKEVGRIRDEKELKERIRAEERAERHQHQQQQQQQAREAGNGAGNGAPTGDESANGGGGGGGVEGGGGTTEEERERERRERRERLKPGSVRYRFQ